MQPITIPVHSDIYHRVKYPKIRGAAWSWREIRMDYEITANGLNKTKAGKVFLERCESGRSKDLRLVYFEEEMAIYVAIVAYKNKAPFLMLEFINRMESEIDEYIQTVASFIHIDINFDYARQTTKMPASTKLETTYILEDPDTLFIIPKGSKEMVFSKPNVQKMVEKKSVPVLIETLNNYESSMDIYQAIHSRNIEFVKNFIKSGKDINVMNNNGDTALIAAASEGQAEIVKLLIKAKADVNVKGYDEMTALIVAAILGHADIVKLLIEAKADVNTNNNIGQTPIITAAFKGHTNIVKLLIDAKANINKTERNGYTALITVSNKGHADIVKLLINAQADVNAKDNTALSHAVIEGHTEVVKLLIDAKANVNSVTPEGVSILMNAVNAAHADIVKLLIDAKADVNAKDSEGFTVLFSAAIKGNDKVVEHLVDAHADVNTKSEYGGMTALMCAAGAGHTDIVRLLIKAQANIDVKDNDGKTALIFATQKGHVDIVNLLKANRPQLRLLCNLLGIITPMDKDEQDRIGKIFYCQNCSKKNAHRVSIFKRTHYFCSSSCQETFIQNMQVFQQCTRYKNLSMEFNYESGFYKYCKWCGRRLDMSKYICGDCSGEQ